jgi:hypothetical protein
MCAYMLSEAGAVACCGWLAACVYKNLSWLRALFAEGPLGVGASTHSCQVEWLVARRCRRRCNFLGRRLQWQPP